MTPCPARAQAGAIRWWTPILALLACTAALIFAAWAGGVDMQAAGERLLDKLDETFHQSAWEVNNEGGELRVEFDRHDGIRRVLHNGRLVPPEEYVVEDNYITVTSLKYDDGELMYWALPMDWTEELREVIRNPRWRLLMRVHPRPADEAPGLRVARVGKTGAAGKAGMQIGDVIVGVEDQRPARSAELEAELQRALAERATGGVVALLVERGGVEQVVRVSLDPLVSQAEWDATPGDDPVERYVLTQQPWLREDFEQGGRMPSAHETPDVQTPAAPEEDRH